MAKQNNKLTEQQIKLLDTRSKLHLEASKSLEGYFELLKKVEDIQTSINVLDERKNVLANDNLEIAKKIKKERDNGNDKDKIAKLVAEGRFNSAAIKDAKTQIELHKDSKKLHEQSLSLVSKKNLAIKTSLSLGKKLGEELLKQKGYLLEQQKSVKETELSMGVLSSQANAFRNNIYKTSVSTSLIGIGTKELAKIQGTYSEEIGRAMTLNEGGLTSVAEMAAGTTLGAEGAAQLASEMENFGISAKGSAKLVDDLLDTSHKMGVNSAKVIKSIQKNMNLAQKYNFKGGIKGLAKMAAITTKFKLEMQSVAGFAEKLITPEGAVEAAAKLQVLGGAWSKLGDPFELMFRSRNDLTGLTEDIINASTATARFDKATGEVTIDPMELHRLREVANVTGISAEELSKMAKEKAKFNAIRSEIRGNFTEEDKDYIESLAQFNKKTGKFEVTYSDASGASITKSVDQLSGMNSETIKRLREESETLKERAEQSQTFADKWDNLLNTFKSALLPGFEVIAKILEGFITNLQPAMKWVTDLMVEWPKMTAAFGAAIAGFALLGDMAMWYMRGKWLRMGFGNGMGGASGKAGGVNMQRHPAGTMINGKNVGGQMYNAGNKVNKWGAGSARSMGAGLALGGAGMGVDYLRGKMDDPNSNGGKWAGVGSSALKGAGMGMMFGPWGAAIGGLLGGIAGAVSEFSTDSKSAQSNAQPMNDFISRPGKNPVSFSGEDTLVGAKKGGPIDKMLGDTTSNTTNDKISVEFNKPIKIEGSIELKSNGQTGNIDLNDSIMLGALGTLITEAISKSINGGRTPSSPVAVG